MFLTRQRVIQRYVIPEAGRFGWADFALQTGEAESLRGLLLEFAWMTGMVARTLRKMKQQSKHKIQFVVFSPQFILAIITRRERRRSQFESCSALRLPNANAPRYACTAALEHTWLDGCVAGLLGEWVIARWLDFSEVGRRVGI